MLFVQSIHGHFSIPDHAAKSAALCESIPMAPAAESCAACRQTAAGTPAAKLCIGDAFS
jgi:hypothetical protein